MWAVLKRTDSTHIEAAIRLTNRIVFVGETVRAALNSLAVIVPDWLRSHVPQEWYDRYEKRMEDFHFPKEATKFVPMIEQIGRDGSDVLKWVREANAPIWLREIPALETLRLVWIQQFYVEDGYPLMSVRNASQNCPRASWPSSDWHDARHLFTCASNLTRTCHDPSQHASYCSRSFVAVIGALKQEKTSHQKCEQITSIRH